MDKLGTLSIFVQAAEGGSFVAASQRLGLSSSAVGKAIARLEQEMGVRLFHRSTRSMTLTEEGSFFLDTCRRVLSELDRAQAQLSRSHSEPHGLLRVSFPPKSVAACSTETGGSAAAAAGPGRCVVSVTTHQVSVAQKTAKSASDRRRI